MVLSFDYTDFEDYWSSFSTGPTRIAQRLAALPSGLRNEIEQHVRAGYLAGLPDGPRSSIRHQRDLQWRRSSRGDASMRRGTDLPLCSTDIRAVRSGGI